MSYTELSVEERATIQIGHSQGLSLRQIARLIDRSPSTISLEIRRNRNASGSYSARSAQEQMNTRRQLCRPKRKLLPGSERKSGRIYLLATVRFWPEAALRDRLLTANRSRPSCDEKPIFAMCVSYSLVDPLVPST